jgi:hypothetical protein
MKKHRYNSHAAVSREDLKYALKDQAIVKRAIASKECLLCCSNPLNEAGLCIECFAMLNDEERRLCEPYFWKTDI